MGILKGNVGVGFGGLFLGFLWCGVVWGFIFRGVVGGVGGLDFLGYVFFWGFVGVVSLFRRDLVSVGVGGFGGSGCPVCFWGGVEFLFCYVLLSMRGFF